MGLLENTKNVVYSNQERYLNCIVEGYGGKIWFDSKEGTGTTFFVKLPIKQKKEWITKRR